MGRDYALQHLAARSACACARPTPSATASSSTATAPRRSARVYGGATVCAWYPITPSTSLAEAFMRYCRRFRMDKETGKGQFAIVQGEDELASIGIVSAPPGTARAPSPHLRPRRLAHEGVPRSRLFRRNSGGDLRRAARRPLHRHADPHPAVPTCSAPPMPRMATPSMCCCSLKTRHECFEMAALAFDLADRLQTPVFVMLDLDIGMNDRLTEPLPVGRQPPDRSRQGDDATPICRRGKDFGRYLDVDGDGIAYRTYPGTHPTKRQLSSPAAPRATARPIHRGRPGLSSTTWSAC